MQLHVRISNLLQKLTRLACGYGIIYRRHFHDSASHQLDYLNFLFGINDIFCKAILIPQILLFYYMSHIEYSIRLLFDTTNKLRHYIIHFA
mgnify:CR=1 FL=1|jgi:hypothetical protein